MVVLRVGRRGGRCTGGSVQVGSPRDEKLEVERVVLINEQGETRGSQRSV